MLERGGGPDRISALPENVLHRVLSLLPAHEAVRTCYCKFDFDFPEKRWWEWQVHVTDWIVQASVIHQARVLQLQASRSRRRCFALPELPLISHRLTKLEVTGVIGNDNFFDFSHCPALVHLQMFNCHINAQKISSPSVTKLVLVFCDFHPATRTHMSFPSLASLELKSCHGRAPFLESMPSLVEAIVRFDGYCADRCEKSAFGDCGDDSCEGCYGSRFDHTSCVCLKSLLEATHLELMFSGGI
uniref:F-box family-2 n=1 Tax=Oryza brachyantha TaxID=4533 RepID=B9V0I8_ORYBR|nr:F-box family-2 [Oryza brachyantha]